MRGRWHASWRATPSRQPLGVHVKDIVLTTWWCAGARLTAYELVYDGLPATLICDSAAAALMAAGKVDAVSGSALLLQRAMVHEMR